jgi:NhaP-type Na+/H+ or K+/H+ antiporter
MRHVHFGPEWRMLNPVMVEQTVFTTAFSAEAFVATLALVGIVIVIAALLSGLIERVALPQVAVFLALGAVLGPAGLGILNITLASPILRVVATLSLALVLFTDAVSLSIAEIRRHGLLTLLVVGPGTLLTAALVALAGGAILGLPAPAAAILGATLASTDPVLLRGLLRRRDIPGSARQALRLESGLNDAVLLPIVLVAMAFLGDTPGTGHRNWARLGIELFLLGPGAGVAVGLMAVATLDLVRRRIGVRRDYESLYSLGVAFTAFAAAEAVHGSGFLAAFAAGLTIAAFDVELCDCFLEYGETTAEMALLFTFVLFGSSLIWSGFTILSGPTLLFTVVALLARPVAFLIALARVRLDRPSRALIAWFGPRGLSSLLLVLLPVFAGLPGSERLFPICCLVVLVSVVLHGGAPMLLSRGARKPEPAEAVPAGSEPGHPALAPVSAEGTPPPAIPRSTGNLAPSAAIAAREVIATPPATVATDGAAVAPPPAVATDGAEPAEPFPPHGDRISLPELRRLQEAGEPVVLLDVRTERTYGASDRQPAGALRLPPDHVAERAAELGLPRPSWLVAVCT